MFIMENSSIKSWHIFQMSKQQDSKMLLLKKMIKYFAPADYSDGRELDTLVKAIIDRTAYNEKLETMHYKNLNEAAEAASEKK